MRDLNDVGRIQYVLDNYDSVVDGGTTQSYVTNADGKNRPAKTVLFSKAVNGTYYVVEAVPDTTKHTTYIVTAYMEKKSQQASSPPMLSPRRKRPNPKPTFLLVIKMYHGQRRMSTRKAQKRAFRRPSRRCATLPLRRTRLNRP